VPSERSAERVVMLGWLDHGVAVSAPAGSEGKEPAQAQVGPRRSSINKLSAALECRVGESVV
jgi:hypothetical protein